LLGFFQGNCVGAAGHAGKPQLGEIVFPLANWASFMRAWRVAKYDIPATRAGKVAFFH